MVVVVIVMVIMIMKMMVMVIVIVMVIMIIISTCNSLALMRQICLNRAARTKSLQKHKKTFHATYLIHFLKSIKNNELFSSATLNTWLVIFSLN